MSNAYAEAVCLDIEDGKLIPLEIAFATSPNCIYILRIPPEEFYWLTLRDIRLTTSKFRNKDRFYNSRARRHLPIEPIEKYKLNFDIWLFQLRDFIAKTFPNGIRLFVRGRYQYHFFKNICGFNQVSRIYMKTGVPVMGCNHQHRSFIKYKCPGVEVRTMAFHRPFSTYRKMYKRWGIYFKYHLLQQPFTHSVTCSSHSVAEMSDLVDLRNKLKEYLYRANILKFEINSSRFNSKLRFVLTKNRKVHLNNCIWCDDEATCGPDTCHCHRASNDDFLEKEMDSPSGFDKVFRKVESKNSEPIEFCADETFENFYNNRVLDRENVCKWYNLYDKIINALQFQIQVRELEKEKVIDAVYNSQSKEWHLTDCIRSVSPDEGPDTCFCRKAMMNPMKYLKERYHFWDEKKMLEEKKKYMQPKNFVTDMNKCDKL